MLLGRDAGVRSTQRLALGRPAGGIALITWPGELQPQANFLYSNGRAQQLLAAAEDGGWEVDPRPHLAFWLSSPEDRVYLNSTLTPRRYVDQWADGDRMRVGQYDAEAVLSDLWPWLLDRGYASPADAQMLDPFVARLRRRRRAAHLRPGLRLLRRWSRDEITAFSAAELAGYLADAVDRLLESVGDPPLPRAR